MTSTATPGRPRDRDVDDRIVRATLELLVDPTVGYSGLTIRAVADRAGVGHPTVYRRHADKFTLVVDALTTRHGLEPAPDTGSLAGDLHELQRHQVAFYDDPPTAAALPGLLADIRNDPEQCTRWNNDFVEPRRRSAHDAIRRAVERGEIDEPDDIDWVCDLLTGPLLAAATLRGPRRLAPELATVSADAAITHLRGTRPAT